MLGTWMRLCGSHPWRVLGLALLAVLGSGWLAHTRLEMTTDTGGLFSASLPWRARGLVLQRAFPQNEDLLVAVIDAATPEEAEATAAALAAALRPDTVHFQSVRQPDVSPYLERNALLFLDPKPLQALLDQTIDAQPFLGQLAADPSLGGLLAAVSLIAQGIEAGQANLAPFEPALQQFHHALAQAATGQPEPLSWQRLLAGPVADLAGRFKFVLVKPNPDYGALEPGAAASAAIRAAASQIEFVRDGRAHVRLTGSVALDDEEFATVAQGAAVGVVGSLVLLAGLLYLAVGTWRMVVPILLTLVLGLVLTTGFAALAVGTLNLVSIAFAVLFVGIAVDFAIQTTVRFRAARATLPVVAALDHTGRHAAPQVLVAALASMAGFMAFTPTRFVGVAQLGLIAGSGMLIAFLCSVTVLPALLVLFRAPGGAAEPGVGWLRALDAPVARHARTIVLAFAALAVLGGVLLPRLTFDSDPLHTKNAGTEAMRALSDLIDDPIANPYTIDILAPSVAEAAALATRLEALPLVEDVISLNSFVPTDQAAKLPLIQDARDLLATTLVPRPAPPPPTAAALRAELKRVAQVLDAQAAHVPPGSAVAAIAQDLHTLARQPDAVLLKASTALTRFLPLQLSRLRTALDAGPVSLADVPASLRQDWVLPDGRAKLQVVPKRAARTSAGLHGFVAQVETMAPDAAGSAVTITGSADTIITAFRTAVLLALAAIAVLLAVALRRVMDGALVLGALLVSALLTALLAVLLPLPLNFANVIALPLLLGVGVSFNVYFVMNWRAGIRTPLGSAAARGVLFSALTTAAAFGALALSSHPGTASMGRLLLLSLGCTLATTLLFLPALLAVVRRPQPHAPLG